MPCFSGAIILGPSHPVLGYCLCTNNLNGTWRRGNNPSQPSAYEFI